MITIKLLDPDNTILDFENSLFQLIDTSHIHKIKGNGFLGMEEINYVLSFGGGVIISQLADLIKSYINRNNNKKVKIGDVEVQGFSKKEIIKIIEQHFSKTDE